MDPIGRWIRRPRSSIGRAGFTMRYRLADLAYAVGAATPQRTVAGRYWSYEPTDAMARIRGSRRLGSPRRRFLPVGRRTAVLRG